MMRTPALTGPERDIDRMEENLQDFLSHILDPTPDRARRVSRSSAHAAFQERARLKETLFRFSPWGGLSSLKRFIQTRKKK